MEKVWGDLSTDTEKAEFIQSGRALETGIIAKSIELDVANAFKRANDMAEIKVVARECFREGYGKGVADGLHGEDNEEHAWDDSDAKRALEVRP